MPRFVGLLQAAEADFSRAISLDVLPISLKPEDAVDLQSYVNSFLVEIYDWPPETTADIASLTLRNQSVAHVEGNSQQADAALGRVADLNDTGIPVRADSEQEKVCLQPDDASRATNWSTRIHGRWGSEEFVQCLFGFNTKARLTILRLRLVPEKRKGTVSKYRRAVTAAGTVCERVVYILIQDVYIHPPAHQAHHYEMSSSYTSEIDNTPLKQTKPSRPFLSFLRPARPTLSSTIPPSVPPPLGPPPPIPARTGSACSILESPEDRGTPNKQYPPVRFITPVKNGHSRNASTPTPQHTPTNVRARSGTAQSSTNTFGDTTPIHTRVIARDYGASPSSNMTSGSAPSITTNDATPVIKTRKQPSPLRLQTTNLGTRLPILSPATPTPLSDRVAPATSSGERRRSSSTGDITSDVISQNASEPKRELHHRVSRSESSMHLNLPHTPTDCGSHHSHQIHQGRSDVYTPASTISTLSALTTGDSDDPVTFETQTPSTSGKRFENVSLPWSTQPYSTIQASLLSTYLPSHLKDLLLNTPCLLLDAQTYESLSSEKTRLDLELDRLKVKHTKLSQHRHELLTKSFARVTTVGDRGGVVKAVQDSIARVDRVARQIYICHDQLRQMEVMKRDHEVGVLLWGIRQGRICNHVDQTSGQNVSSVDAQTNLTNPEDDRLAPDQHTSSGSADITVPNIHDQDCPAMATIPDWDLASTSGIKQMLSDMPEARVERRPRKPTEAAPKIMFTRATLYEADRQEDGCEYLASPDEHIETDSAVIRDSRAATPDRPMSTLSISLSPINLGFPLPPSRPIWPSAFPSDDTESTSSRSLSNEGGVVSDKKEMGNLQTAYNLTPTSDTHSQGDHQITIYPPSHNTHHYLSSYGLESDLPHTPMISDQDHSHSSQVSASGSSRSLPPLPSFRARRSRPDLTIPIPIPHQRGGTRKTIRQISIPRHKGRDGQEGPTSPLRLISRGQKMRYQSLKAPKDRLSDGTRRFKKGRDSCLETPESILLSLATAELWTKDHFEPS